MITGIQQHEHGPDVALSLANRENGKAIMIVIDAQKGTGLIDMRELSNFKSEKEILGNKNIEFIIQHYKEKK